MTEDSFGEIVGGLIVIIIVLAIVYFTVVYIILPAAVITTTFGVICGVGTSCYNFVCACRDHLFKRTAIT